MRKFFDLRIIYNDFAILDEIRLMWDLKLSVGSNKTPKNFTVGSGEMLTNSIGETRSLTGNPLKLLKSMLIIGGLALKLL